LQETRKKTVAGAIRQRFFGTLEVNECGCKIRAAGKIKSFSVQQFFKNAAEVWASSPHLRSKLFLQSVFPAAIAFFEIVQFK